MLLLEYLEKQRFTESKVRELPRLYDKLCEVTRFRRSDGDESMSTFSTNLITANGEVGNAESSAKISDAELDY